MPVILPPACAPNDLGAQTTPRTIQHPIRAGYGVIVHCRPAFECQLWPVTDPIPPEWVEVPPSQQDNVRHIRQGVVACDIKIVDHKPAAPLVGAVPARPRPSPARARPERAPRAPRARRTRRPARDPRPAREPRKPREPRAPREARSRRTPVKFYPSYVGWRSPGSIILTRFPKNLPAIPTIGCACIYDYYDTADYWVKFFRSFPTEAAIDEWCKAHTTDPEFCRKPDDRSLCSVTVGEIANILTAVQQIEHGIPPPKPPTEAQLERIKKITKYAGPAPEAPPGPVTPPTPPPAPAPTGFVIWSPINPASIVHPSGPGGRIQTSVAFYSLGGIPAPGYLVAGIVATDPGLPSYG